MSALKNYEESHYQLPNKVICLRGGEFNPNKDVWKFRSDVVQVRLDFGKFTTSENLKLYLKKCLIYYIENYSPHSVKNIFDCLVRLFVLINESGDAYPNEVKVKDLINFAKTHSEGRMHTLNAFFKKYYAHKFPGFDRASYLLLDKFTRKNNKNGRAVLLMDPIKGALTDIEYQCVFNELVDSHYQGLISLNDMAMTMLSITYGIRPIQIAALKVKDFYPVYEKEDSTFFMLNIPRAKQGKILRAEIKARSVSGKLAKILLKHIGKMRVEYANYLNSFEELALFPHKDESVKYAKGFEYHKTSARIGQEIHEVGKALNAISERTGKPINLTATRLRHTIATRCAEEGYGAGLIAEVMDHTRIESCNVYIEVRNKAIERIENAINEFNVPLAQAFKGLLIKDATQAKRNGEAGSFIYDPRIDSQMRTMGTCGQHDFCGAFAPIACYTCRKFEPWLDGPHEKVLEHLLNKRELSLKTSGGRIAAVNDLTIHAVREVIRRCSEINGDENGK